MMLIFVVAAGGVSAGCGSSAAQPAADAGGQLDADADADAVDAAQDPDPAVACVAPASTTCPSTPVRYPDVQPILAERCVNCHFGGAEGPWPLDSYSSVATWADVISADIVHCTMPPADAGVSLLTTDERTTILTWISCGSLP